MLGPRRNLDDRFTVKRGDGHLAPQGSGHKAHWHLAENIVTLTLKDRMGLHSNGDIKIAWGSPINPFFTFASQSETHARFHTSWDRDSQCPFPMDPLPTLTHGARLCDDPTSAFTLRAGPGDAKKSLLKPKLTGPTASGAGSDTCARTCASPVAVAARLPPRNLQLDFLAVDGLLKR